ncbi:hypothetical protein ACW5CM_10455 [Microbacterium sp. A588]
MNAPGRSGVPRLQQPVVEILFFGAFCVVGILLSVFLFTRHGGGAAPAVSGVIVLIFWVVPGAVGMYIGFVRQVWKRRYKKAYGTPPF